MNTEWHAGSRPPDYHDDPTLGGPPLASADGHWWWDGQRWIPRTEPAEPAA